MPQDKQTIIGDIKTAISKDRRSYKEILQPKP